MATDLTAKKFLNRAGLSATPRVVDLFDSVRRIPYAVTGDRTAEGVVECWRGSCSGKHALLWLMLQHFGHEARIVTVETTVDSALPARSSIPREIFDLANENVIPDFHHYVQLRRDGGWIDLDATWNDQLVSFGFAVNRSWDGVSDTLLAFAPNRIVGYSDSRDLSPLKSRLIADLPRRKRELRGEFFRALTDWLEGLQRQIPDVSASQGAVMKQTDIPTKRRRA